MAQWSFVHAKLRNRITFFPLLTLTLFFLHQVVIEFLFGIILIV